MTGPGSAERQTYAPAGADRRPRLAALAAVALLAAVGLALRLGLAGQSVFADELSTQWIVYGNGLGRVLSLVHSDAEITPPLFFVLSWLTTRLGHAPELLRLPSLIAGVVVIPLTYAVGVRAAGRAVGLVGAALVTFSPFLILYSSEARGYEVMIALVLGSTLALLRGAQGGGRRWWVLYGVCTCLAMYTHYTAAFPLATQLVWLLASRPAARRPALLANVAAVVGFLPWITGFINDLESPTTKILSLLEPFTLHAVRVDLGHWAIGHPYAYEGTTLGELPGAVGLILLAAGLLTAGAGLVRAWRGAGRPRPASGLLLILALALCVPVAEALVSAVGTNLFGVRNLAVGWPFYALALAAFVCAPRGKLRIASAGLVVCAYAIGAALMLESRFGRVDYGGAAHFIDSRAKPGDIVLDRAVLSPGPLAPLAEALPRKLPTFRAGRPQEDTHPFNTYDPIVPLVEVNRRAVAAAAGHRIFVVSVGASKKVPANLTALEALPASYRAGESRVYPGVVKLIVTVYSPSPRG